MYARNERIVPIYIEDEMKASYISYAMSVIVGRALPDVRDGLKPVHRRILYAMKDLNLEHNKPFKKAARIVGECLVKDTLILTDKGLIPIQDIKVGDFVYTQRAKQAVTQLYEMPERELLKVQLENGMSNTVTPSQKFKVLNSQLEFEWKEARSLTTKDHIVVRAACPNIKGFVKLNRLREEDPIYLNNNIAYLLGLFISEGWIEEQRKDRLWRLCFYSTDIELMEKVAFVLFKEFNYNAKIEIQNKQHYKTGYLVRINNKEINDFLIENFSLKNRKASNKEIPQQIFISPKDVIFSFISGLVDGDGSIHKERNVIHYGSISERLIDQLMTLLQHQGIFSYKYIDKRLGRGGTINGRRVLGRQKFYYIEIRSSNALLLASNLSVVCKKKSAIGHALTKSGKAKRFSLNLVPYASKYIFEELSERHLGGGWYRDIEGNKFRMGIKYPTGCKIRYSSDLKEKELAKDQIIKWNIKNKLQKMGSKYSSFIDDITKNDLYFLNVSSVKKVAAEKTYDIQVEGEHEFVANGMIVHNCLGKYHPHGDVAVYDTLVRLAQNFSMRYPLIDGQGNFGSIDGDAPAAMRYTEARLTAIAEEMLEDLDKDTVDFMPNFDDSMQEPKILPSKFPNLLINGSSGIAVGMATNIPPHNLGEIVDAITLLINEPEAEIKDLMKVIKGPDFPTGGIICGREGIKKAYTEGRGILKIHAKANVETQKNGKESVIITEIPYQVNKTNLIESIANLVQDKKIEGISNLRDESDKEGMRIVIELKRDANSQIVLNQLYKHTQMQETFGVIMLALVDNRPLVLNLKDMLRLYIDHRKIVITRRTQFELNKALDRAHILEGLKTAVDHIDKIIKLIRTSKSVPEAKAALMKNFDLSEKQAQAILEMQLQKLTHLERQKLEEEYLELIKRIELYRGILKSEKKILEIIKDEILKLKEKYNDERRTEIVAEISELDIEDLIAEEDMVITISHTGYIKRLPVSSYRKQRRGGVGITGVDIKEEDFVEYLFVASTHDYMLFFTDKGRAYWLKVHEIPQASRIAKGKALVNVLELGQGESITALKPVKEFDDKHFLVMVTRNGTIKKTRLDAYSNPRKGGIIAIGLEKDDKLIEAEITDGKEEIVIATHEGKAIRFSEKQIRDMGRAAKGVRGIRLAKKDYVVSTEVVKPDTAVATVTELGFGKRTKVSDYRSQSRGGKGVINVKVTKRNGPVVGMKSVTDKDELILISQGGMIVRCPVKDIRISGRSTQGVRLISLKEKDRVACVARVIPEE